MIIYLLKVTLCSACFLGFYRVLLEREKLLRFNRFYLLGSLLLSIVLPLVPLEIFLSSPLVPPPSDAVAMAELGIHNPYYVKLFPEPATTPAASWLGLLGGVYLAISAWFLIRFGRNLFVLLGRKRNHEIIKNQGISFLLIENLPQPYSFLNYIFVDREAFQSGTLEAEILAHERSHVRQLHSLDVLFIELVKVLFWCNPVFYFYRDAMVLNHEFLADASVVQKAPDISAYQHLLLRQATRPAPLPFVSQFNFSFIKKRFVMMNKQTSRVRALLVQSAALPVLMLTLLAFSDLTLAQVAPPPPPVPAVGEGITQEMMDEYKTLTKKYFDKAKRNQIQEPSKVDGERMEALLAGMSKGQLSTVEFTITKIKPLPRITPTDAEFEKYKDSALYGVWIDEKKVPNSTLDKYKAADFSQVYVSKLYPNAQKTIGYKYKYQVDLMTTDYYESYRKETLEHPKKYIVLKRDQPKK